jgi:hypothetical protein
MTEDFDPYRSLKPDSQRPIYKFEVNPWMPDLLLEDAILFRGAIISAWGYIEMKLIELAIRSSHMSEYSKIRANYPYKLENRLGYLRKVLETDGPFSRYRNIGTQFLDRFEQAVEIRHLMAHASMDAFPDWGITFFDYKPAGEDKITHRRRRFTIRELESEARKLFA